jgi:hypothetical protein
MQYGPFELNQPLTKMLPEMKFAFSSLSNDLDSASVHHSLHGSSILTSQRIDNLQPNANSFNPTKSPPPNNTRNKRGSTFMRCCCVGGGGRRRIYFKSLHTNSTKTLEAQKSCRESGRDVMDVLQLALGGSRKL